ncbi:MAG: dephospho-CoA kinase [Rhodocyclaceae bacterium]|nr:dephospho-CoA kinase [Rhodocyclaceae bacterium]
MPFIIGLTGGIGSGKSAAASLFGHLGATVVDTDAISHELTGPGGLAMPLLKAAFGEAIAAPDGSLDRPLMRRLAFSEPGVRTRLEDILHPLIRDESRLRCETATGPYVVLVVPLLLESGDYRRRVARVLVVDCPEETQVDRVMARSQLPEEEVRRIMAAQIGRPKRLSTADDVIENGGGLAELEAQVAALHRRYLELAGGATKT